MPSALPIPPNYPLISESDRMYTRALDLIPAATQTLAKGPGQHVMGVAPKYLRRGSRAHVWDVDGNRFLDMNMGIGPLVLGYAYPAVDDAIRRQLDEGITFSLMHPLEVEVAEAIREAVPCAEFVRFSKTGADVTSAAVRLARAYTGRNKVLCCGYHGWHDWYVSVTGRNLGVPSAVANLTFTFEYNDLESVRAALDSDTACVILEPVVFTPPAGDFLQELKKLCNANGTLLVFDEMWTGFRLALGGAQTFFGVVPDLATFSKAVANGMPLSVLAGRRDIMSLLERDVFFFTTFGGEVLSLAAAKATIAELKQRSVPEFLARQGKAIKDGYNQIAEALEIASYTRCVGMECRTLVTFDPAAGEPLELRSLVQQELIRRAVLWSGFHNVSFSHGAAEVSHLLAAYEEVLPILKDAVETGTVRKRLKGKPVEPLFRRTSGFNTRPAAR
ncbi:MAG TPA: aminotransferase class III-fold pyridoxal phosphate-dependent enzyme [Thermoanaerobaculaceae bacterium]|nr:aminotransferase class III-fold pyridoxal phosphate-dependent enzyme [Thermoanaerobaculaceae bacterium]